MNWKDALAAIGDTLPADDDNNAPQTEDTSAAPAVQKEPLHVVMERKGRAGKTATIIEGFLCDHETLAEVAKRLRHTIGTGGSARGGEILLQGDHREKCAALLLSMGYKVKN